MSHDTSTDHKIVRKGILFRLMQALKTYADTLFGTTLRGTALGSVANYRRAVILLFPRSETGVLHRVTGTFYMVRSSTGRGVVARVEASHLLYSNGNHYEVNSLVFSTTGAGFAARLVTCQHAGQQWLALELTGMTTNYPVTFYGTAENAQMSIAPYQDTSTGDTLDQDILDTIAEATLSPWRTAMSLQLTAQSYMGGTNKKNRIATHDDILTPDNTLDPADSTNPVTGLAVANYYADTETTVAKLKTKVATLEKKRKVVDIGTSTTYTADFSQLDVSPTTGAMLISVYGSAGAAIFFMGGENQPILLEKSGSFTVNCQRSGPYSLSFGLPTDMGSGKRAVLTALS